jgi:type I restriction enzyme S subunit
MWLEKEGRRLDCGPYLSGAIEAKVLLEQLQTPRKPLSGVTLGGLEGIFNGPRFSRNYVHDSTHGIPFLGSTDILDADLRYLSLLSKKQVAAAPNLLIEEGWTLITRSGTIGRMAYARAEMRGMAGSEDFLRVVPDPEQIKSGYLFAYLSSRFGVPLIVGGTYGAIIQHIEPRHIASLPVPIAPAHVQSAAHKLSEEAGDLRTKASAELRTIIHEIEQAADLPPLYGRYAGASPDISVAKAQLLGARMDGLFHSNYHRSVVDPLLRLPSARRTTVAEMASKLFWPPMFKRIHVEDLTHGVRFFGTSALMRADPDASYLLAKRTPGIEDLVVRETTVLVPGSGQLNGIIRHAVLPYGDVLGGAVTHDAIRIFAPDKPIAGYVFACLSSEYGRRQLKARAFGSSIPHLDAPRIGATVLPRIDDAPMRDLGLRAFAVASARDEAVKKEREARALVEQWIKQEGGA